MTLAATSRTLYQEERMPVVHPNSEISLKSKRSRGEDRGRRIDPLEARPQPNTLPATTLSTV